MLSRRKLLKSTLLASTVAVVKGGFAKALEFSNDSWDNSGSTSRLLLDRNWRFVLGNAADPAKDLGFDGPEDFSKQKTKFKFSHADFDDSKWRPVDLPHDWAIELEHVNDSRNEGHGFYPLGRKYPATSVGWYRRQFRLPAGSEGKRVFLEFDGIYRNSQVFVNGFYVGIHESGYSPSAYDLTDFLDYKGLNAIVVRVDATHGDGWFYEGAGIYRHTWLTITDSLYFEPWETVVRTEGIGAKTELELSTLVRNRGLAEASVGVRWEILDAAGKVVATIEKTTAMVPANGEHRFAARTTLVSPSLWSPESPYLYHAVAVLVATGSEIAREMTPFGVRSVEFTVDQGMLLNGKQTKLKGVCNHQDHAGVGTALPDRLQAYRLELLLGMGCNALRTSHNYPTPELIEACDRLGIMVMCETRTFSSSEPAQAELSNMIRRFRNHPCVVIWSLGNEEKAVQGFDEGERIAARNQQLAHQLDPTRKCTFAMNGTWGGGLSKVIDVQGFNYHLERIEDYHQKHPHQPLIGTETASTVGTRGIYANDPTHNWVDAHDLNSLDKKVGWGSTAEEWWKVYGDRSYMSGGFAWTGFDYRGEPTPYHWPSTSSQFGIMDLCGFPKDAYFYYKSWWSKDPVLHVFPHWNWEKVGQPVQVWVYSNLDSVELFLNGKSLGSKPVPHFGHVEWPNVPYEPGVLEARGTKQGSVVLTERRETTGNPASLRLTADRQEILADGEDLSMVKLEVLDAKGRVVPTACVKVHFELKGAGRVLGFGNGDPNSLERDSAPVRDTFNGLAQAILQSKREAGSMTLTAKSEGLETANLEIRTRRTALRPSVN